MRKILEKTYNPQDVEDRIYKFWLDNDYFKANVNPNKKPFTIVIPPPNVTGQLHMGHAFDETLQDIIIRYKRKTGYETLWVPGTDHAGIATQIKVEEKLRKEQGITRYDLGREEFLKIVWDWKEKYGNTIIKQLQKIGSSCDWSRLRFTMDEGCSNAVKEVFVNLYNKGLIYRGNRIINWCPHCVTALSDAEVEHVEKEGHFWYIKYPIKDSDEYVTVATTRPETMLGDTAVAVNPEDERYKHLIGKSLILPLVGRIIPVIADEYVDKEFGTGCVKITPAHDPNDFEVGLRHDLEQICVLDGNAKINELGGKYQGLDRYEARKKIVEDLEAEGLLLKIENHVHNVGTCYRCGTVVEPITSKQWFVKMKPLAGPAMDAVINHDIKFIPDRFSVNYLHWMENIHDWCISRQLWWGHRIPAYYCEECGHMVVSKTDVDTCPKCGGKMKQDEDVLDTWFSSALWPFSTLGWPEETEDYKYFYPTNTLVTGYDIIPFWVSRMIFSGLAHTGKAPFDTVFIHGLIRDSLGRKFSKSLGNGIDPLEMIDKFGADALRYTLIMGNSPGNDMKFAQDDILAYRNFCNKLWNAARFVLTYLNDSDFDGYDGKLPDVLELEDKWIISELNDTIKKVTDNLEKCELGVAAQQIYDFIWDKFCDWYIEVVKPRLFETNENEELRASAKKVLCYVLNDILSLLHPFMPFVTEEIWQSIPHCGDALIVSPFPRYDTAHSFSSESKTFEAVIDLIKQLRQVRISLNVPMSKKAALYLISENENVYRSGEGYFKRLGGVSNLVFGAPEQINKCASVATSDVKAYIPMGELIDIEKEKLRLEKEKERLEGEISRIDIKLSNPNFTQRAPKNIVDVEIEKKADYEKQLNNVLHMISNL